MPLPVDADDIREALDTSDPASAALASLVVFHALRIHQLRALLLTDYGDGRLHVDGRTVLLAKQARQCLRSYLDYRSRRWPHTANPHLFVTVYSANRATPVSHGWVSMLLGGLGRV